MNHRSGPPGVARFLTSKSDFFQMLGYVISIWFIAQFAVELWQPLFIAVVLAIISYPVYEWLCRRQIFGWRLPQTVAAMVVVLGVAAFVITPIGLGVATVLRQATQLTILFSQTDTKEYALLMSLLERVRPPLEQFLGEEVTVEMVTEFVMTRIGTLALWTRSAIMVATTGLLGFAFGLGVILLALFYFLVDGKRLVEWIFRLSPVPRVFVERVTNQFWEMTLVMVKVTAIIGVAQGSVGALGLYFAGTSRYLMWGIIMTFLSIMPIVGAAIVLLSATCFYLFWAQDYQAAAIVFTTLIIVTQGDNILKSILVSSHDVQMPGGFVMLSAVAGIPLFGALGFLFGPITFALPIAFLGVYHNRRELRKDGKHWRPFQVRSTYRKEMPKRS